MPQLVTLDATLGDLRQVVLPVGARYIEYSSTEAWFYEVDTGQADSGAGTAAAQQRIDAGTSSIRCPGSGSGRARLPTTRSIFIAGSSSAQSLWLTATSRGV